MPQSQSNALPTLPPLTEEYQASFHLLKETVLPSPIQADNQDKD
ncbi:hypothetical protein [Porphyromonas sp. COT-108 OH1349]|nr:hypothetical protein [Porphyromonas sp. COT-108 OH1349]